MCRQIQSKSNDPFHDKPLINRKNKFVSQYVASNLLIGYV